ncbi:carboxylesterase-like [Uloborus diversus]|uniref:carboxylesterase-like n=1 Tax=Uloborus diversus TaxID=327109 RepID=UPI00240A6C48|nr:carboxylesterase-like [Uloborus diversus]
MSLLSHRPYSHLDNDDDRFLYRRHRKVHRKKLHRCLLGTVVVLSLLLAAVVVAAIQIAVVNPRSHTNDASPVIRRESSAAFEDALVVRTNCGEYIGTIEDGAFVFKGMPYAKAPVGHLRWKKPISWWSDGEWCGRKERRRAHKYAKPCFHLDPETKKFRGTEDCLYLNVWSPRLDTSAGLEVMVWIHGGFLQWGSGHEPGVCPSGRVAKRLNAVFVSFNYRLGALGFMALDILSQNPQDAKGNYGLWDQVVALQWVKQNIRAFGGDPEKVTVFGADSGAASILALQSSEIAKDLFRSAWLLGPSFTFNRTFEDLSQHHRAFFLARSSCTNATCLRHLPAHTIAETYLWKDEPSFRIRDQNDLPIPGIYPEQMIVLDGELLQQTPIEAIASGNGEQIPTLVGTTAQAINIWPGPDDLFKWKWSQLSKYVVTSLDSFGPGISHEALELYNTSLNGDIQSPEEVYSTMVSDLRQTCPIDHMIHFIANASTVPLYRYVITSTPSIPIKILGYPSSYAFHQWDVVAFFDHMEHYLDAPTSTDFTFRDELHRMVRAFIRSGGMRDPIPGWNMYPLNMAQISRDNVTIIKSYHEDKCNFWKSKGFEDFAWVS